MSKITPRRASADDAAEAQVLHPVGPALRRCDGSHRGHALREGRLADSSMARIAVPLPLVGHEGG
jgi:hypothetical protein